MKKITAALTVLVTVFSFMSVVYAETTLIDAVVHQQPEQLAQGIREGLSVHTAAKTDGAQALHGAAKLNRTDMMQMLLDAGAAVNAQDARGLTPLHWCAAFGAQDTALLLVENGADINALSAAGRTPLHQAVAREQVAMIVFLMAHGADASLKDAYGMTPLYQALKSELTPSRDALINAGVKN